MAAMESMPKTIPGTTAMREKHQFPIFQRLNYRAQFMESHVFIHVHYVHFMDYQFNSSLHSVYNMQTTQKN